MDAGAVSGEADTASLLAAVQAKVEAARAREIRLIDPDDEDIVLVCRVPTSGDVVQRLLDGAKPKGRADAQPRMADFSRSVLVEFCDAIEIAGRTLTDPDGVPLRFRDRALRDMLGAPDGRSAVSALLTSDGHISSMVDVLLTEGGFSTVSDGVRESDPT
jgi:hypothetical protein